MGISSDSAAKVIEPHDASGDPANSSATLSGFSEQSGLISVRELIGDTAVYGLASVAERGIGFVLLPVMTAILNPTDYGIISLFSTTSQICFIVFSLGIHQGFLRYFTEAQSLGAQRSVLNTSLFLALSYWLLSLPLFVLWGDTLNRWIFGSEGSALILALAANSFAQVIGAVASNRLQAEGRAWAFFTVTVLSSVLLRAVAIYLILIGMGAWGWVLSDTLGHFVAVGLLVVIAMPDARLKPSAKMLRPLATYGMFLVPSVLSFYVMTVADKYLIRALSDNPLEQVGFYSVGERIAGLMQLANLAFIFGWQRFAFRNMHLEGGSRVIARGLFWFAICGSYLAMSLGLLGDDITQWMISASFAPGIVVITPITIAALLGGLASAAEIGLHQSRRPLHISYLNVVAALINIGLNFWAIPRWGIAGAANATMVSQAIRLLLVWLASHAEFPLPLEFSRLAAAVGIFTSIYWLGQLLLPFDLLVATIGQTLLIIATPFLLWSFGFLTTAERQTLRDGFIALRKFLFQKNRVKL